MTETSNILPSEFNARRTADLVGKIEAINNGSKEPLTRSEIAVLAKMNAEMVAAMRKRLTDEANTVWDKSTDAATNKAHKDYWDSYATRLQAAIDAYSGKLAQITTGATDDLAKLKETTKPGNVLGDATIKNKLAPAPAVVAPTTVAAAPITTAPAPATVEKKDVALSITAFVGRIKDSTLNTVNRVKTDIVRVGELLTK